MIRCIVVDDNPLAVDVLEHYISKVPLLELVFSTVNPLEALNKITGGDIDLVFLDIQMPELSGLQFMKIVQGKCQVILTTAYAEYALDGFENDAVDYLLKPVSFERFYKAVEKARLMLRGLDENKPSNLTIVKEKELKHIFVKTEYKLVRIDIEDIIYAEGLQNYVIIHTTQGKITSLQTMIKTGKQLPAGQFMRIHKSFIIALNKITTIERNQIHIGDKTITLGEVYRQAFYEAISHK